MTAFRFPLAIIYLFSGLLVWAAHFGLVYGLNGLACARGFGISGDGLGPMLLAILGATLVAAAAEVLIVVSSLAGRGPGIADETDAAVRNFWRWTTCTLAVLSLIAVIWTGVPVFFIEPCA